MRLPAQKDGYTDWLAQSATVAAEALLTCRSGLRFAHRCLYLRLDRLDRGLASGTGVQVYRRSMEFIEVETGGGWVPQVCTLPTAERPLRVAEFDALFAEAVLGVERVGPGRVRLGLEATPQTAGRAAELVAAETGCCSFFTFTLTATGGQLWLEVTVPAAHIAVLDALSARARDVAV